MALGRKGLPSASKGTRVNLKCFSVLLMWNKNLNAFLSSSFTPIYVSKEQINFVDIRTLTIMSQRNDCNGGPVNVQSLMLIGKGWGLALASNTMRTFVVTGLHSALQLAYVAC